MAEKKKPGPDKKAKPESHFSAWLIIGLSLFIFLFFIFSPSHDGGLPSGISGGGISESSSRVWNQYAYPLFLFLDIILFCSLIVVELQYSKHKQLMRLKEIPILERKKTRMKKDKQITKSWNQVANRAKAGGQSNLRLAILEGDALVDLFLKKYGYEGETMADRLSQIIEEDVRSVEQVWKAHRLRNDIAHNPSFMISKKQAQDSLTAYRDFLIEVGVL